MIVGTQTHTFFCLFPQKQTLSRSREGPQMALSSHRNFANHLADILFTLQEYNNMGCIFCIYSSFFFIDAYHHSLSFLCQTFFLGKSEHNYLETLSGPRCLSWFEWGWTSLTTAWDESEKLYETDVWISSNLSNTIKISLVYLINLSHLFTISW